jgi:hypothetical protein
MKTKVLQLSLILALISGVSAATRNIKDPAYGARGDGSTDDTAAIQRAINACRPGDTVLIPSGTYKLSRSPNLTDGALTLASDCTYQGQDNPVLVGYTGTGSGGFAIFYGDSIQNVTITGVVLNGGGVYLEDAVSNFTFTNNTVTNLLCADFGWTIAGLVSNQLSNATITDNTFSNMLAGGSQTGYEIGWGGIQLYQVNKVHINHNNFDHIGGDGIAMSEVYCIPGACDDNQFNDNTFTNIHRMAIELQGNNLSHTQVKNNTISNYLNPYINSFGISFPAYDTSAVIQGNKMDATVPATADSFAGRYGYCIEVAGANTIVDSNVCSSHGTDAVRSQWVSAIAISTSLYGAATNLTISNNTFCGPQEYQWQDPNHPGVSFEDGDHIPSVTFSNNTTSSNCF